MMILPDIVWMYGPQRLVLLYDSYCLVPENRSRTVRSTKQSSPSQLATVTPHFVPGVEIETASLCLITPSRNNDYYWIIYTIYLSVQINSLCNYLRK